MEVYFWGTRGSLPASFKHSAATQKLREVFKRARGKDLASDEKLEGFLEELPFYLRGTYGTNTPCVEIRGGEAPVLCDAGSGLRDFAVEMMSREDGSPKEYHLFMSHYHWDHIMGFPFFTPAYIPGHTIHIYGCHEDNAFALRRQQEQPSFPVPIDIMGAQLYFHQLEPDREYAIAGFKVRAIEQNHPGVSYGYRFEKDGQSVVYSTDSEHTPAANAEDYPFIEFFRDADVLIFDAQYELFEHIEAKVNWGHSSNVTGVELAVRSGAKRLCLFHNEHTATDQVLEGFELETVNYLSIYAKDYPLEVRVAYDGLRIDCAQPPIPSQPGRMSRIFGEIEEEEGF